MNQWQLNIALSMLGLDDDQKRVVEGAIPIAAKMVDHISNNKQLFATLSADFQLVLPAAKIILDALASKGYTFQSLTAAMKEGTQL